MTLVAAMFPNEYPILIGDIIVSSGHAVSNPVFVPTVGKVQVSSDASASIIGLRQKTAIVSENLCVAWSGSSMEARTAIRELKEHFGTSPVLIDELFAFLRRANFSEFNDLSLVGFVRNDQLISSFGWRSTDVNIGKFGNCHIAGSGTNSFITATNDFKKEKRSSTAKQLEIAVGMGLAASAHMIGLELNNEATLGEFFGGAYELVTFVNGQFRKFANTTYLTWVTHRRPDGNIFVSHPRIAIRIAYHQGILLIRRLLMDDPRDGNILPDPVRNHVFAVPPVDRNIKPEDIKDVPRPSLNPGVFVHIVFHTFPDGRRKISCSMDQVHKAGKNYFEEAGGMIRFTSDTWLIDHIKHLAEVSEGV
jgi:hypothetical protein